VLNPDPSNLLGVRLILYDAILRPEIFVKDKNFACLGADCERVVTNCHGCDGVVAAFIVTDLKKRITSEMRQVFFILFGKFDQWFFLGNTFLLL
jgi:hypothetical protein